MILVIATIQIDIVRIDDEGHTDENEHFHAIGSSIHNITVEYVRILIRRQAILIDNETYSVHTEPIACTYLMEDNHEIRQVPVEIADDRHASGLMRGDDVHIGQSFEYATSFVQDQKNEMRMENLRSSEINLRALLATPTRTSLR